MSASRIEGERVHLLNQRPVPRGRYVLYWMQASQRASWNHALEYAVDGADALGIPVVVLFCLTPRYPEANLRHYAFMLDGLRETARQLTARGIRFALQEGYPPQLVLGLAQEAAMVVVDRGYLRHLRAWRREVAEQAPCPVVEVEADAVVPIELAYPRAAVNAAVLRRRIMPVMPTFLHPLEEATPKRSGLSLDIPTLDVGQPQRILAELDVDRSVSPVPLPAGTAAARAHLARFLKEKLDHFAQYRNDPGAGVNSGLSPYLHFGQISPLEVAWQAAQVGGPGAVAFLEELVVRRELALNYVFYHPAYDRFEGLPSWAQETLRQHAADRRAAHYTLQELEEAQTEDPIWNAAQNELRYSGQMHGYLRMYWGKRLLLWMDTPQEALRIGLYLNNKYALDGRDPSSFAGVGWCFGLHDRPFPERPIFGKVRAMTPEGIQRKFDLTPYFRRVGQMLGVGAQPAVNY